MTDYISRDDALVAVCKWCEHPYCKSKEECGQWIAMTILPSAELPKGDLISRADALMELNGVCSNWQDDAKVAEIIHALPSADAVPTVIRAKTFMRKEDFDKWAEDIKRQNKRIVCIPCDAEVVSADAVQGEWISEIDTGTWMLKCSVCGCRVQEEKYRIAVGENATKCPYCGAELGLGGYLYDEYANRPSQAEMVSVVRCKDCRHAYFKDFDKYCPYVVGALKPDGYCHHGERREP